MEHFNIVNQARNFLSLGRPSINYFNIQSNIAIVGNSFRAMEIYNFLNSSNLFNSITLIKDHINNISGYINDFNIMHNNKITQANLIIIVDDYVNKSNKSRLGLMYADDDNYNELIEELNSLIGEFEYEDTIYYEKFKCQPSCQQCVDICPTIAINNNDAGDLEFSNIDCIFCGKCAFVCPSGAMNKVEIKGHDLAKLSRLYYKKIPLILNESNIDDHKIKQIQNYNKDIIPFYVPNINMLNEVYLIAILQECARPCIIMGDFTEDDLINQSVNFINDLYRKLFNKTAIYLINIEETLDISINLDEHLMHYVYHDDPDEFSRNIFSNRLKYFIKDNNYGELNNQENIIYGNIHINADKCTLCLSCVTACNTKALINSKNSFELLLNPSLCTMCGYCIDICPENIGGDVMKMSYEGIELEESYFKYNLKASDEGFNCLECNQVFATKKSINKISSFLIPKFGDDLVKRHSLFCCPECKVKLMFNAGYIHE